MQEIEVDGAGHVGMYCGVGQTISFSIVSAPRFGNKQVREFATCRDYISDCIIACANAKNFKKASGVRLWTPVKNAPVDFANLRLLIHKDPAGQVTAKENERRIFAAKRVINMYEEYAGWPKKSTIRRVKHNSTKVNQNCWLLIGPARWMRATQLVSMVTLIFRVIANNSGFTECENLDQVEERFKQICKEACDKAREGRYYPGIGDLKTLLPNSYPKWRALLTNYDEMFWSKPKEFWFPKSGVGRWHGQGGIHSLCTGSSTIPHIKRELTMFSDKIAK